MSDVRLIPRVPASAAGVAMIAAVLAGAGCGSSGSSDEASAISAASVPFPVAVGNTWKYKSTANRKVTEKGKSTESRVSWTETDGMTSVVPVTGGHKVTMIQTSAIAGSTVRDELVYFFHSDGTISYSQLPPAGHRTTATTGDFPVRFPPAAVVDSGRVVKLDVSSTLHGTYKPYKAITHVTIQGDGTATVTVPTGTYRAVVVTDAATQTFPSLPGDWETSYYKTWLAPGVGPVQQQLVIATSAGLHSSSTEELESFIKG